MDKFYHAPTPSPHLRISFVPCEEADGLVGRIGCLKTFTANGMPIAVPKGPQFAEANFVLWPGETMVCELPGNVEIVVRKKEVAE